MNKKLLRSEMILHDDTNSKRNAVSVAGISYLKAVQTTNSPTNAELENGKNWSLVSNGTDTINHKAVPIARIISRG